MPFYQKGEVRIRYEEAGTGFPLLVTPGGGLNSRIFHTPQRSGVYQIVATSFQPNGFGQFTLTIQRK